jgi:iron-sulfur cluster protein
MSAPSTSSEIRPRSVADKRDKAALLKAIRMALQVESAAVRHNTQTFNRNRYTATAALPDYDQLKDRARALKEFSIANLPDLLRTLEESVRRNGGQFYLARDAHDASRYITEVCKQAGARLVVKGKSMTSEEVHLNHALEAAGIEVAETDLAEFILQVADEQPSHIVGPALHYSRERITALFKRVFQTDLPLDTGEALTAFARDRLRDKFLTADAGISGANLIAADTGTIMLVESEGNIRMSSLVPPVHIAIAGVEKVIPKRSDLAPFLELLGASATGQPMTSYTSFIRPPLNGAPVLSDGAAPKRQFHLVLVDNGRMKMRDDPDLREALRCIRCGACLNSCANFQTVGGHAFGGETYSGGIGGSWEAGTKGLDYARFSELCTGCSRCVPQCPVRIDIPWLNIVLRQRLNAASAEQPEPAQKRMPAAEVPNDSGVSLQKTFFGRYDIAGKWGAGAAVLTNWINQLALTRWALEKLFGVDRRRHLPPFASKSIQELVECNNKQHAIAPSSQARVRVTLFADVFTAYGSPERAAAAVKVLRAFGVEVEISEPVPDGRAALSQGMVHTAKQQALTAAKVLKKILDEGRDVIVVEPSVLAMFRLDYRHLLTGEDGAALFERLRSHSYDASEYVWKLASEQGIDVPSYLSAANHPRGNKIFYHSHCQQKTIGAAAPTEALLRAAGFDVATSIVECCGMAGSFGYKKEFYELSMAVAGDLFNQVRQSEAAGGERILVATGTSCQEQLQAGFGREVLHPMELLAQTLP